MQEKILVPVDGSDAAHRTLAAIIDRRERFTVPMTLLHVVNIEKLAYRMIPDFQLEMLREPARKAAENLLREQQEKLAAAGLASTTRLEFGSPRETICRIANDERYDLLVIGRRGMGEVRDVLFGSVSNYVLHHVRCPVLLF